MDLVASPAFWWPVLVLSALILVFLSANWFTWWVVALGLLVPFSIYSTSSWWSKTIVWLVYLVPAIVLTFPFARRPLISDRMLQCFRQALTPMSEPEWQAVDAGTVWWEAGLFRGRPRWKQLLGADPAVLSVEERDFLSGPVEKLCALLDESEIERQQRIPANIWKLMKSEGFLALAIPESYGGKGLSSHGQALVLTKVASRSISAALSLMVPTTMGLTRMLVDHGSEEQKSTYLPRIASGECVPTLALSGRDGRYDAASIQDRGIVCRKTGDDGQPERLGVRLTLDKPYVPLATIADLVAVSFELFDPEHLLGPEESLGVTVALLETQTDGVERGSRLEPMHLGLDVGPIRGRDILIPLEAVIGGQPKAGKGWPIIVDALVESRLLSVPSLLAGATKLISRATGAYSRIRYQFRSPIGFFEGIQQALARIAAGAHVVEAVRQTTDTAVAAGERPGVLASIVKYKLVDRSCDAIESAMEIHGASGAFSGSRNLIDPYYRFAPIASALDGSSRLSRNVMIFGQGALRCHPQLRAEVRAATEPHRARAFDKAFARHLRLLVSNAFRSFFHGLTGGWFARAPIRIGELRPYCRQISRMSTSFAFLTDLLILMCEGDLTRRERLSSRMAEAVSELFIASAVIRHRLTHGADEILQEMPNWVLQDCLWRTRLAFEELFDNLPVESMRRLVRFLVFPFSRGYRSPDDRLEAPLATTLMVPSTARDRQTLGMYLSMDIADQLGRLEDALAKVTAVEPLEHKLADGVRLDLISPGPLNQRIDDAVSAKLLTPAEADMFREAETTRRAALSVDEYPPHST